MKRRTRPSDATIQQDRTEQEPEGTSTRQYATPWPHADASGLGARSGWLRHWIQAMIK
ncbi:MAG: hypothetical protein AB7K71_26450 [Polyangiaceae bacterium]